MKKKLKVLGLDPVTHKPTEPKENNIVEEKKDDTTSSTNSVELNKMEEEDDQNSFQIALITLQESHAKKKSSCSEADEKLQKSIEVNFDVTNDVILKNCEIVNYGSLDFENWMNQENNISTTSTTTTTTTTIYNSVGQWVDGTSTVDSLLSWDVFKNLEQDLFFFGNYS